jgi:hypothetical protein
MMLRHLLLEENDKPHWHLPEAQRTYTSKSIVCAHLKEHHDGYSSLSTLRSLRSFLRFLRLNLNLNLNLLWRQQCSQVVSWWVSVWLSGCDTGAYTLLS